MRAKDAFTYLRNTPNQFTSVELISHKKEIGANAEILVENKKQRKREEKVIDDDGFTVTKKR